MGEDLGIELARFAESPPPRALFGRTVELRSSSPFVSGIFGFCSSVLCVTAGVRAWIGCLVLPCSVEVGF